MEWESLRSWVAFLTVMIMGGVSNLVVWNFVQGVRIKDLEKDKRRLEEKLWQIEIKLMDLKYK